MGPKLNLPVRLAAGAARLLLVDGLPSRGELDPSPGPGGLLRRDPDPKADGGAVPEGRADLFLISADIVMKACSTLVLFLAEVSRKGISNWSAKSCDRKNTRWEWRIEASA